jgi:cyclophilin family peptidyl-prolyl cis-trans isomerase
VANFRAYLNDVSNGYTSTVFHRLISGFVLQGGAYKKGASSNAFLSVPKLAAVQNEPGIANTLGTLAMAKQGGNPNSATTDFFFNLADNTGNLDYQNEGFTVFGRVAQPSLSILSVLNGLPQPPASGNPNNPNYAVTIDGQSTFLTQLPHNAATAPASINPGQLLTIDSVVSSVPVLSGLTVSGNTNSSAVLAAITGTDLNLNGLAAGASTISLQVSDLDGNQLLTPLSFNVTVMNTLSAWAAAAGLPSGQQGPDADPDNDGRKNLLEYALMSSPGTSDGSSDPAVGSVADGADKKASITFKVRKFATLTYIVEGSSNLASWSTVWTSTNGFAAANVSSAVNNADHTLVTIKDSVPYTDSTPRFLRLTVTSP